MLRGRLVRCFQAWARISAALKGSPTAAALAAIWVVASAGLVLAFPREQAVSQQAAGSTVTAASAVPVETLAPEQLAELHTWLDRQPAVPEAMPQGDVKVLLLKFNDYQCPSCRQAYILYNSIIEKYVAAYPGVFRYESRDFPLESECGAGGVHAAACEAAVAVRLAKEKNMDKQLEATLFERQSMSMTRDDVKAVLREVTKISDERVRQPISKDARGRETRRSTGAESWCQRNTDVLHQRHQAGGIPPCGF